MPTPTAIEASNKFRQRLLQQEADAITRMGRIYARIYRSLQGEINDLADDIWLAQKISKKIDKKEIIKLARLQRIKRQVADEVTKFGVVAQGEIENIRAQAIQQGIDDAIALIDASLPVLPGDVRRTLMNSLTRLPADAVEQAAGLLAADSPLMGRLEETYGFEVADLVEMHIIDGIAVGQNPRTIAAVLSRNLPSSLGIGLNWVATTVRTAQIKSYQLANHATYQANSAIVPNWVWVSSLDIRTCMSCIAKHGSVHPVTETMQDHHNGRCLISGEIVETQRGRIAIESVIVGDMVLTHAGNYREVLSTSKRKYSGDVYNINGLTTTPEHPFLTQRGWVEAKDLIASDTLFTLKHNFARLSIRRTVHPSELSISSFFLSCRRLFLELCQHGSSSTASIISGKAKSILKLSIASWGMGLRPTLLSASKNSSSLDVENSAQFSWRNFANDLARLTCDAEDHMVSLKKFGLRFIWRVRASLDVIGSILNFFIKRIRDLVFIPASAVSSLYDAPSLYRRESHSPIGSSSCLPSSFSHFSDCNLPISSGVFLSPNFLDLYNTDLYVLFNRLAISGRDFVLKYFFNSSSSSKFHSVLIRIISPFFYGRSIHHPNVKSKLSQYCGDVYNLQVNIDESFVANGVIVHNCAPLPQTISYKDLGINLPDPVAPFPSGEEWFNRQPDAIKRTMLGPGKFEAWQSGKFKFANFSVSYDDGVYGQMFREATLKEYIKSGG